MDEFSGIILVIYDLSRTWINDKQTVWRKSIVGLLYFLRDEKDSNLIAISNHLIHLDDTYGILIDFNITFIRFFIRFTHKTIINLTVLNLPNGRRWKTYICTFETCLETSGDFSPTLLPTQNFKSWFSISKFYSWQVILVSFSIIVNPLQIQPNSFWKLHIDNAIFPPSKIKPVLVLDDVLTLVIHWTDKLATL